MFVSFSYRDGGGEIEGGREREIEREREGGGGEGEGGREIERERVFEPPPLRWVSIGSPPNPPPC